jgi:hypothetical protein
MYIMDAYQLSSDPCDYRLIRINNWLQVLAFICEILALFIREMRQCVFLLRRTAELVYCCVSGCMTAQVFHDLVT